MQQRVSNTMLVVLLCVAFLCCKNKEEKYVWNTMIVTATAYNSVANQTQDHPEIAAWGDTLRPDMKCIAVSRDLLAKGLKYNTPVRIEGFEGTYLVKDKMHQRWENRIDIFMGKDVKKAKEWGRRKVTIQYGVLQGKVSN